jgi:hypothetical protein
LQGYSVARRLSRLRIGEETGPDLQNSYGKLTAIMKTEKTGDPKHGELA